jgi:hypothetical protein
MVTTVIMVNIVIMGNMVITIIFVIWSLWLSPASEASKEVENFDWRNERLFTGVLK